MQVSGMFCHDGLSFTAALKTMHSLIRGCAKHAPISLTTSVIRVHRPETWWTALGPVLASWFHILHPVYPVHRFRANTLVVSLTQSRRRVDSCIRAYSPEVFASACIRCSYSVSTTQHLTWNTLHPHRQRDTPEGMNGSLSVGQHDIRCLRHSFGTLIARVTGRTLTM